MDERRCRGSISTYGRWCGGGFALDVPLWAGRVIGSVWAWQRCRPGIRSGPGKGAAGIAHKLFTAPQTQRKQQAIYNTIQCMSYGVVSEGLLRSCLAPGSLLGSPCHRARKAAANPRASPDPDPPHHKPEKTDRSIQCLPEAHTGPGYRRSSARKLENGREY